MLIKKFKEKIMAKNDRKFEILYAIIMDYIRTAEPVGSRSIEKNHGLGISSATIRNEMADLEEMGYLIQPHASAGRVPSDKAYRLYVDKFLQVFDIDEQTNVLIRSQFEQYMGELDETLKKAAEILTKMTNYTTMVSAPNISSLGIKDLRMIHIDQERIFLILITEQNIVKNTEVKLSFIPVPEQIDRASVFLRSCLVKSKTENMLKTVAEKLNQLDKDTQKIISEILPFVKTLMTTEMNTKVYADGLTEILNYPEFQNVSKAKQFLETMHKQELLAALLQTSVQDFPEVRIGTENNIEELSDCSIVTATYKINGRPLGTIGLIGPTRMNYDKCISALNALTNELSNHINQNIKGDNNDG